jgi:hypothetical protein
MGGWGSTRWAYDHERRATVEECWLLDVRKLKRALLKLPEASSGPCWPVKISTKSHKVVNYDLHPSGSEDEGPLVELHYTLRKDCLLRGAEPLSEDIYRYLGQGSFIRKGKEKLQVTLPIELTHTVPHFGGKRWWFTCPLKTQEGLPCRRRVAKLWLPEGQMYFGCSKCHGLGYQSSLESHDFLERLASQLAAGAPDKEWRKFAEKEFKRALKSKKIEIRRSRENAMSVMDFHERVFGED